MLKDHHLAGAIADASWGEFVRMIEYKAEREGRYVVHVDTYFPSSKTCSQCGYKRDKLDVGSIVDVPEMRCAPRPRRKRRGEPEGGGHKNVEGERAGRPSRVKLREKPVERV